VILFVATDEELASILPLDATGGASLVPPIVDPASDYERFLEERAPGRLRTMPHVMITNPGVVIDALGFEERGPFMALPDSQATSFAEADDDALAAAPDDVREALALLRKLARVAVHRGGHVLAYALKE
jgi:hypothetical protein